MLKKVLGSENVTVVSGYQTYPTGYGKRLYPDKRQLEYIKYFVHEGEHQRRGRGADDGGG